MIGTISFPLEWRNALEYLDNGICGQLLKDVMKYAETGGKVRSMLETMEIPECREETRQIILAYSLWKSMSLWVDLEQGRAW